MAERIWAPWRITYIEKADAANGTGCIFVDLPTQDNDRENLILFRGKTAFVMLNRYPYTNGHLMVAPYRHTMEMAEMGDDELLEVNQLVRDAMGWIKSVYGPQGFNVGINIGAAGGAGIPTHIHWHIVPRWTGDTNFMTTVGDVRVMPEDLTTSWERLRGAIGQ